MKRKVITATGKLNHKHNFANVFAAEGDTALDDIIATIKADFDYIVDGLETLSRRGAEPSKQAMAIATSISTDLEKHIGSIAGAMTGGGNAE